MLYHLLFPLREMFGPLNVVQYITFRAGAATTTALVLSIVFGPAFVRFLQRLSVGQSIREEGPESHQVKAGTPTMGGVLILFAVLVPTILWADMTNPFVLLTVGATAAYGLIGFVDDYIKVARRHNQGLSARGKLLLQTVVGVLLGWGMLSFGGLDGELTFPFFKNMVINLGIFYIPFAAFILVGASNAVNLTDGLDGLAIGATLIAAGTYAVFTYIAGNSVASGYLQVPYVPGAGEVTIFLGALVGASLGFLWFNAYPAEVFMGDVGSLSLGGAIGSVALVAKQEIVLAVVGGVFVLEAVSVILQVGSFKLRGRRIFRMAPIHHHFEMLGWKEPKIIVRFWIASILCALLGLSTLKLR